MGNVDDQVSDTPILRANMSLRANWPTFAVLRHIEFPPELAGVRSVTGSSFLRAMAQSSPMQLLLVAYHSWLRIPRHRERTVCIGAQEPRTPIWDQVFTMTSVTDGFQLCRARIRSRRGMSVSRASLPAEPGRNYANYSEALLHGLQKRYAGGIRPGAVGRRARHADGKPRFGGSSRACEISRFLTASHR